MNGKTSVKLIKNVSAFLRRRRRWMSSLQKDREGEKKEMVLPPEPSHCCMTGCPNCVWIKYAQELAEKFDNGDDLAREKISEKVKDPNLRAYLFTALGLENTAVKGKCT